MKRKPELIVPIRDRRSRRRIFTLKNFAKAAAVLVVIFVLLSFDWHRTKSNDYGRLLAKQVEPATVAKPMPVVTEAKPIEDQTGIDPLLIAPAAREQQLGINVSLPPRTETAAPAPAPAYTAEVAPLTAGSRGVSIVGDENGVSIVKTNAPKRPLLTGGIFKQ